MGGLQGRCRARVASASIVRRGSAHHRARSSARWGPSAPSAARALRLRAVLREDGARRGRRRMGRQPAPPGTTARVQARQRTRATRAVAPARAPLATFVRFAARRRHRGPRARRGPTAPVVQRRRRRVCLRPCRRGSTVRRGLPLRLGLRAPLAAFASVGRPTGPPATARWGRIAPSGGGHPRARSAPLAPIATLAGPRSP